MAAKDGSIIRSVMPKGLDAASASALIEQVQLKLISHAEAIYSIFDYYAMMGSSNDVTHIQYNSYHQMLDDSELIANEQRGNVDGTRWDELFVALNTSTASINDEYNNKKGLNRQEFLELILRAAVLCHMSHQEEMSVLEAIETLITNDILPNLMLRCPMALQNSNDFRLQHCYTEEVDAVLRRHESTLQAIYQNYSTITMQTNLSSRKLMDLAEWRSLLDDVEFIDNQFSAREARMCFVWSRMRVIREGDTKSRAKVLQLSFEDFMEALIRMATMKSLPTDRQIKQAHCEDGGEFFLRLHLEAPAEVDTFTETNDPSARSGPIQPTPRAIEHVIAIWARMFKGEVYGPSDLLVPHKVVEKIVTRSAGFAWRDAEVREHELDFDQLVRAAPIGADGK